ncbi:MAG TPA: aspartyl protease family protein [Rhizomicrobium sp.]|nr:aspartyl protease family protein [Rhizomicrobium sp.]
MPKHLFVSAAIAGLLTSPALAAPSPADILAANRVATAGDSWAGKATLTLDYSYSGQGLRGKTHTLEDLAGGRFLDSYVIGPDSGSNGFDGARAWLTEPSGTVTWQGGGDTATLAVNESYRDRNLWWQPDFGGAVVISDGTKTDAGESYDVITVTPKDGKPFDAWFDAATHQLARTREWQETLPITTYFSDYAPVDGVQIARKQIVDDSTGASQRVTLTLTGAKFLPPRPDADYAKPVQQLNDFEILGGKRETTVPFKLINNHIYAMVSVNGGPPMQFLFDTGGHDILTPPTARTLGVKVEGASTSTGGGDNAATSGNARVHSIRIGDAIVREQPVSVIQFDNPAEGVDEQGMIGYEFFARFTTRIDYGRHTLTFIDAKSFDPKDAGTPVPFRFYQQFPEIIGTYDNISGRFGIDTGARTPLSLNRVFVADNGLRERAKTGVVALTGWGVGGPTRSFVTRGGTLTLGDLVVAHPLTEFSVDKGGAGAVAAFPNNVGGGVLKRFVITLDYAHYQIWFKPIEGPVADLDTFDRSGMWINAGGGGFKIVDVTKNGPADRAGLREDDVIVAVDDKAASGITLGDLREKLRNEAPGTVVRFSVKTGKSTSDVSLTLREQI